jgi:hypothetical protein
MGLFSSPKLDFSRIYPNLVTKQTVIKGDGHTEGSILRHDDINGNFLELEVTRIDRNQFEICYTILRTDVKCYKDLDKIIETWRYSPISFSGCPFK